MNSVATNVWDTVLLSLKTKLNQQTLDTWFQPIKFEQLDASKRIITLRAPNHVVKDWVVTNFSAMIEDSLKRLRLDNYELTWLIDGEGAHVTEKPTPFVETSPQQRSFSAAAPLPGENPPGARFPNLQASTVRIRPGAWGRTAAAWWHR